MSFGRPLMIVSGGENLRLPDSIDDRYLSNELDKWNTQPDDHPSLLKSYIETIKLYDILGKVLDREDRKDPRARGSYPGTPSESISDTRSLLSLDTMIMEWRDALPPYLQYHPSPEQYHQCEAFSSDGNLIPQADLIAQAKRLYTRYGATHEVASCDDTDELQGFYMFEFLSFALR